MTVPKEITIRRQITRGDRHKTERERLSTTVWVLLDFCILSPFYRRPALCSDVFVEVEVGIYFYSRIP